MLQCLHVYSLAHNLKFMEINKLLQMKAAKLQTYKHPAPPLFCIL